VVVCSHVCKQGTYQCKLQGIFCVFTSTSRFKVYPLPHWTHLGVQVHISNVLYCHYKFMLKPKMYVYHERLFILSTWIGQWKYHDLDFCLVYFILLFIRSVENEHAVSNTFLKWTSRFCCSSVCNSVSKAKTPSKLSVSGPERLDVDVNNVKTWCWEVHGNEINSIWQPKCRRFPSITIVIQLNYGLNPNLKPVVYGSLKNII
jgi:hypothetical protein